MPATIAPTNLIKVIRWTGDDNVVFFSQKAADRYTCEEPVSMVNGDEGYFEEVEMTELDLACYEVIR